MRATLARHGTTPLWAVLGAPLVGVPLMVGLLALAAPKGDGPEPAPGQPEAGLAVEEAESSAVEYVIMKDGPGAEPALRRC